MPRARIIKVGTDKEVEEVMRLRLLYGRSPSRIARQLKIAPERIRELIIAGTYYGLGLSDGLKPTGKRA